MTASLIKCEINLRACIDSSTYIRYFCLEKMKRYDEVSISLYICYVSEIVYLKINNGNDVGEARFKG
jgi:hypothetical protein